LELQKFKIEYWQRSTYPGLIKREEWRTPDLELQNKCDWCWKKSQTKSITKRLKILEDNYAKNFKIQDDTVKIIENKNWKEYEYAPVEQIIIHHTWDKSVLNKKSGLAYMKRLYIMHAFDNWWDDIWYHYLIDAEGNVYEWNVWGKYVIWAHVFWHNIGTVWISMMWNGNYSKKQINSLLNVINFVWRDYWLNFNEKQDQRKSDLSWREKWWSVVAHKEIDSGKPIDPKVNMNTLRNILITKK
jgi:hypothetical protein